MSETNGQSLDPLEVATLAADDPRRQSFARKLTDPAQRELWEREWADSDRLRMLLQEVSLPPALAERLKGIPDRPAEVPSKGIGAAGKISFGWRSVAAILIVTLMLVGGYAWYTSKPVLAPMDRAVSRSIAQWAVKNSDRPLEIASRDAEAVKKKLESYGFNFPVVMLTPSAGSQVVLEGGGMAEFGSAKAVYTKWAGAGYQLTLYEFNGKDVSAPPLFQTTSEVPQDLWEGEKHYRVLIFPGAGGKCCWALVMDTDAAENPFGQYTSGAY